MTELPIHPERQGNTNKVLIARQRHLAEQAQRAPVLYQTALGDLAIQCVYETLRLTGESLEHNVIKMAARDTRSSIGRNFLALETIRRHVEEKLDWNLELLQEIHRLTSQVSPGHFRTTSTLARFVNAKPAAPELIELKLDNLREWLASKSGRDMITSERAALAFARMLEIAPFERGNFRAAHLMMNFFSLADGFPYIYFEFGESQQVREDIEQAFLFDTLPLVKRVTESIERSLFICEKVLI